MIPLHTQLAEQARKEARLEFNHGDTICPAGFYDQRVFDEKFAMAMMDECIKICREQKASQGLDKDLFETLETKLREAFDFPE